MYLSTDFAIRNMHIFIIEEKLKKFKNNAYYTKFIHILINKCG